MVQNVLADSGRTGLVKRDSGEQRRVGWEKEISVNGRKGSDQNGRSQSQRDANGHERDNRRCLACQQYREREESHTEDRSMLLNETRDPVNNEKPVPFKEEQPEPPEPRES